MGYTAAMPVSFHASTSAPEEDFVRDSVVAFGTDRRLKVVAEEGCAGASNETEVATNEDDLPACGLDGRGSR